MDPKQRVEAGYDQIAEQYLSRKDEWHQVTIQALEDLTRSMPPGAHLLDLGCGAGVPVTRWLAGRFATTGVDVSARQLELARLHAPGATYLKADMSLVDFHPATFDAVVAFYSIIHLPRGEQPALVERIFRWLKPGGGFLATWATGEWEGEESDWEGWGAPMWWSHYDGDTNLEMLRRAGFEIAAAQTRSEAGEKWLWALARKPAANESDE